MINAGPLMPPGTSPNAGKADTACVCIFQNPGEASLDLNISRMALLNSLVMTYPYLFDRSLPLAAGKPELGLVSVIWGY